MPTFLIDNVTAVYDQLKSERIRLNRDDYPSPGAMVDLLMATENDLRLILDMQGRIDRGQL